MISAPDLLATAVSHELVRADEVITSLVTLEPATRSNIVHRLARGNQPVAFVKQRGAASWLDGDDPVRHEARVLRGLSDPLGGRVVPALLPASDDEALWTGVVPGTLLHQVPGAEALPVAHAFGVALAGLHAAPTTGEAPLAPRPWVLDGEVRRPSMTGGLAHGNCSAVAALLSDPTVAQTLLSAAGTWPFNTTWIHGDLSAANVVVQRLPDGALRVGFVDLEDAGVGNPAWDLATALDTLGVMAASWGLADLGHGAVHDAPVDVGTRTRPSICQVMTAFADGYETTRRSAGSASPRRSSGPLSHPVWPNPVWRCARLITRAWQTASAADSGDHHDTGEIPTWPATDSAPTWPSSAGGCGCPASRGPTDPMVRDLIRAARQAAGRAAHAHATTRRGTRDQPVVAVAA